MKQLGVEYLISAFALYLDHFQISLKSVNNYFSHERCGIFESEFTCWDKYVVYIYYSFP